MTWVGNGIAISCARSASWIDGFRSAFRDWGAEETNYPGEIAEAALAHAVSNEVGAAYRRIDFLEKRRALMREWPLFCTREVG